MVAGPETWVYAVSLIAAILFFGIVFIIGWTVSKLKSEAFRKMSWADKGDWCSRVGSTVHSIIIVPGFICCMAATEWDADFWPVDEGQPAVTATRVIMCISMGYFVIDFILMLAFRIPLWVVFVVHHIVASLPFYVHLFWTECRYATFVMQGFLLVETANLFMNTLGFLDNVGLKKSNLYTVVFYINFIGWPFWRIIWPLWMVIVMYLHIYFHAKASSNRECMIPAMTCGHLILVFCVIVFFGVLVPDVVKRCSPPAEEEKEKKDDGCELDAKDGDENTAAPNGGAAEVAVDIDDVVLTNGNDEAKQDDNKEKKEAPQNEPFSPNDETSTNHGDASKQTAGGSKPSSRHSSKPPTPSNIAEVGMLMKATFSEIGEGLTDGEGQRSVAEGVTLKGQVKPGQDGTTLLK